MSKKHYECSKGLFDSFGFGGEEVGGRNATLPTLIILILILLQFSGRNWFGKQGHDGIDNGILFIIALFYLSCCSPCKSECR